MRIEPPIAAGPTMKGTVMTTTRSILLGTVFGLTGLVGLASAAAAADLGMPAPSIKDSYAAPAPSRSWYLKGTIGAANSQVDGIDYAPIDDDFTIHHLDMKSAPFFGLGVGVQANRWLRLDATGEYRGKQLFVGHDSYFGDDNGDSVVSPGSERGTNDYEADIESWMFLANGYIDLGKWCGITPYVGAGLGVANLSVEGFNDINNVTDGTAYGADSSRTNFAWAVYAGMSYDVTPQVTLDLAYRYADLGDATTGVVTTYDGAHVADTYVIEDITSHDLMVSMRWKLEREAAYMPMK